MMNFRSEETKSKGVTVLVDARSATWRSTRSCIRRVGDRLLDEDEEEVTARLIALRPDGFWDKQRVDNYCTRVITSAQGDRREVSERFAALSMLAYKRVALFTDHRAFYYL